jgi:hypothetical protein
MLSSGERELVAMVACRGGAWLFFSAGGDIIIMRGEHDIFNL